MSNPAPEATDKRVQRSKAAVMAETYRLLFKQGIGGLSIDEVSRRSGVSKTTIYRHWPSRGALLLDACSKMSAEPSIPDTGSLQGDLNVLATDLAEQLRSGQWPAVLPSIIDAAERDPEVARMQARLHASFMTPFHTVAERAHARGEIATGRTAADIVASVVGPLFYRRWFSKEPIDARFVERIVGQADGIPSQAVPDEC